MLLEKGAEVDLKNKEGVPPLWIAAKNGHKHICRLLISKGASIDWQNIQLKSPVLPSKSKNIINSLMVSFSENSDNDVKQQENIVIPPLYTEHHDFMGLEQKESNSLNNMREIIFRAF